MNEDIRRLTTYRLERAREALESARLLLDQGHLHGCVNRLYYACFYAVSALLLNEGLSSSKHAGVIALFNRHWIKSDRLPREMGSLFNTLFAARQEADYTDMAEFSRAQVSLWQERAEEFICGVAAVIGAGGNRRP
jgi:hypothetical protein